MRKHFFEYFRPTQSETTSLWADAVFVFDTNVLLNLYRMSRGQSVEIRGVLTLLKGRLFLPHQVGFEFFKHVEEEIAKQVNAFELVKQRLKKIPDEFSKEFSRHPCIPIVEITAALKECVAQQIEVVQQSQDENPLNFLVRDDPILSDLVSLFEDATEESYTERDDDALNQRVEERVTKNLPPCLVSTGSKASIPPANNPHRGDGRVWFQIVKHAEKIKKPIIYVTGDMKINWWRTAKLGNEDKPIGPHFQLIHDVATASEQMFWMYTQEQFLSMAAEYLNAPEQTKAIEEIKQLQEASLHVDIEFSDEPKARVPGRLDRAYELDSEKESGLMANDIALDDEPKAELLDESKKGQNSESDDEVD